jgi:Protein of unknown function (DUF402)
VPWRRGDAIALREIWRGRIWEARPAIVVDDAQRRCVLYVPARAGVRLPMLGPRGERRVPPQRPHDRWRLRVAAHAPRHHVLSFAWPDRAYAVLLMFEPSTLAFRGWYVNLQSPLARSDVGFDTVDHALDVVVAPDGAWAWKDEDELARFVELGLFTADEAREFRADGERAIERLRARAEPFDDAWLAWRPDARWPRARMPRRWDDVHAARRG